METNQVEYREHHHSKSHYHSTGGNAVYGLGFIGAAIFFIGQATTFWLGVLGFLKAIVWPVFLVLEAFKAFM
ncbi:hypothetical protein KQH62_03985 [bacterium]|nr:hypothetical protein [bacterium]